MHLFRHIKKLKLNSEDGVIKIRGDFPISPRSRACLFEDVRHQSIAAGIDATFHPNTNTTMFDKNGTATSSSGCSCAIHTEHHLAGARHEGSVCSEKVLRRMRSRTTERSIVRHM
jgi:hypothetical protein